ncbi:MAG: glycosyltransferase [Actinobacteria bacterium]|nr:glycosyltransferase [Actinomycetota bacterium]
MRVLHILNELRPSGFEVMLKVSAPYWQKMDVQAELLATGKDIGQYAQSLEEVGYKTYHLPFSRSYLRARSFFASLYKFLRSNKYDVVHAHVEGGLFWIILTAKLAGVPQVVKTIHNVFPWRGWLGFKRRFQKMILRFMGIPHVSVGPSVRTTEWEYFRNPTLYIPNWYDSERFVPLNPESRNEIRERLNIDEDTFTVVSVGNCSRTKNHTALLGALANISDKIKFLYLHVGEEEPGQPERHLAGELGITKQVHFLGFVEDISPILNAADVYVMPSLHEGFSIAAMEAMGAGVPSILADVPGLRDFKDIADGVFWVNPEAASLSEALITIASMPKEKRREIGLALHHAVYERFSIEQGVGAYASLYVNDDSEVGLEWGY